MIQPIQRYKPLRKARLALGLTTSEAAHWVHVTRKTWEAWEIAEENGKPTPKAKAELFFSKLEKQGSSPLGGSLVVVFFCDPITGHQQPIDVVSTENYLGTEAANEPGKRIIKSLAIEKGRPYVHRTEYAIKDNEHVEKFCEKNTPV